jgi:hypothetical protein
MASAIAESVTFSNRSFSPQPTYLRSREDRHLGSPGAGSLYWLGTRDNAGAFLDGGKAYKLTVPQPVPAKLFWSVTVYDAETRSEIQTDQGKAALRSLFELKDLPKSGTADLYFGPKAPSSGQGRWIKTISGKGWFVYFRIYGPSNPPLTAPGNPPISKRSSDFEKAYR